MKNKFKLLLATVLVSAICLAGCGENAKMPSDTENSPVSEISSDTNETQSSAEDEPSVEEISEENISIPDVDDPTPDAEPEFINGLLVYNGVAYEQFFGNPDMAKDYSDVIVFRKSRHG